MKVFISPKKSEWINLLVRPALDAGDLKNKVGEILDDIKGKGFHAVRSYSRKFDGYDPDPVAISATDIEESKNRISSELRSAIDRAAKNIEIFHRNQLVDFPTVYISKSIQCWQKDVPIEKVGFYIPGGTAPLFSTVLMLGIPAMIAGCSKMELCTPANSMGEIHPAVLYAASICGITEVYRVGGIQAIGAMAYGAGEIESCDKIFGPGNQYVTMAKQLVSEDGVSIDMPAGPSEVLVMADSSANPEFVAADLLSQAEHGDDSQVILLCSSEAFAISVNLALEEQLLSLPRAETAKKALENSRTIVLDSLDDMMEFSNLYAPEHLIISVVKARAWAEKVINAGSVFIGQYTPESAGDYASGTNHTLPTSGYARSFSGLNMHSFMKTIQYQEIQKEGLFDLGPDIITMAEAEGLRGHANAVGIRLKEGKK